MGDVVYLAPPVAGVFRAVQGEPLPLPYYAQLVSAGFPSPALDFAREELDLNRLIIKNPTATFLCKVQGNSMKGAGIFDGDMMVVDTSRQATSGSIVVVALEGDLTVKRFVKERDGYYLKAENPLYHPIPIGDASDIQIFGVVIGNYHPTL